MQPSDFVGGNWQTLGPYLLPALFILIVLRRNLRARPLKIERMWFYPSLMVLAVGLMMVSQPPPLAPIALSVIAVSAIVGSLVGWQRGRLTHITIDPETHDLTSKTSPVGMILVLALFAVKYAMRFVPNTLDLPVSAAVLTDAGLVFAVGLMTVQRLEMWTRARQLLADAQAAKAGLAPPSANPPIVS